MNSEQPCQPRTRPLHDWEIQEARKVFADRILYERVRIHECASWPNWLHRIGSRLKGIEYSGIPNAVTIGNRCFFPVPMLEAYVPHTDRLHYKLGWLIHELTHVWQYQHLGWRYLWMALSAQFRLKDQAYHYGGESELVRHHEEGGGLWDFNLEQQGDIARDYYNAVSKKIPVTAWEPFVKELRDPNLETLRRV